LALGWLLAGLVVLAQADVTGSLEGTIYDEGSGKAVGGVKVMISPKGRSPALPPVSPAMKPVISDDEGRFSFNELPPGEYTLNALKKDYFFFGKDQLITIQAGGSVTHVMELRSFRPSEPEADGFGSLSGVVQLTPGREPVVDAVVTLHPQDSDSGQGLDARTRTDGRFEIEDISNGRYILRVSKPGFTDARTNVIIRADQVTTKTVRITPDSGAIPFGSLAGVALNLETGEPIPGVRVSLSPIGQAGYIRLRELGITLPTMETGDDGSYTISDIPEGEYTLSAVLAGYEWVKDSASVEVSGDKETRRQLDLRAPVDDDPEFVKLEGHVYDSETGLPIPGAIVSEAGLETLDRSNTGGYFSANVTAGPLDLVVSAEGYHLHHGTYSAPSQPGKPLSLLLELITTGDLVVTILDAESGDAVYDARLAINGMTFSADEQGRVNVPQLEAGDLNLVATHPAYLPSQQSWTLKRGQQLEVTIELAPITWGTLTGSVVDSVSGRPLPGATIRSGALIAVSDDSGLFKFEEVPAGMTNIAATLNTHHGTSLDIELEARQTLDVELSLDPITTGAIKGMVVDGETGHALANALVRVGGVELRTGADGRFRFDTLEAGPVSVLGSAPLYQDGSQDLEVVVLETREVHLELEPITTGNFQGVVLDAANGQPVVGVRLTISGQTVETSADGSFTLRDLPMGSQDVRARHADYKDSELEVDIKPGENFELELSLDLRREDVTELEKRLEEEGTIDLYGIHFDSAQDKFKPSSMPTLEALLLVLQRASDQRFQVAGHTDSDGEEDYNQDLSERRAANVIRWLTERGVPGDQLVKAGYGESSPTASNDTESGKALNRRVQLSRIGE